MAFYSFLEDGNVIPETVKRTEWPLEITELIHMTSEFSQIGQTSAAYYSCDTRRLELC